MPEFTIIFRALNVPNAIHSARSLYKLILKIQNPVKDLTSSTLEK